MSGHARVGAFEHRVLSAVGPEPTPPEDIACRLGAPLSDVQGVLVRLVESGLADAASGLVWLTEPGRQVIASTTPGHGSPPEDDRSEDDPSDVLIEAAQSLGSAWMARAERASAERRTEAEQRLASDADRDLAVQQLSDAFCHGRLSSAELEDRTGRALAARTHGELDAVLDGLGGLQRPVQQRRMRTAVFWVATVVTSPFLLLGTLLLLFGSELDDHLFGLVILLPTALPLFGLWRWSRPART